MKICEKSDLASSYYKEIQSKKSPGAEKLGLWCAFVRTLFFFCELFCELQDSVSFGTLVDFHSSQIQVIFVYEIFYFHLMRICSEPYARERDSKISEVVKSAGVQVISIYGHTLCEPEALLREAGGKPTTTYGAFCNHLKKHLQSHPIRLAETLTALPPMSDEATAHIAKHGSSVPSLVELGYASNATTPFHGGETEGLAQMRRYLSRSQWVAEFEKPNTNPAVFRPDERSTTVLSPYLKVTGKELQCLFNITR